MGQISVPTTPSPALLCRGQPAQAYAVAQRPCKRARVVEQSGRRMVCEVMGQASRQGRAVPGSLISGVKRLRVKSRGRVRDGQDPWHEGSLPVFAFGWLRVRH